MAPVWSRSGPKGGFLALFLLQVSATVVAVTGRGFQQWQQLVPVYGVKDWTSSYCANAVLIRHCHFAAALLIRFGDFFEFG